MTIGLVAVFMVVGGIVIMNIMLASVTERTPRDRHPQIIGSAEPRHSLAVRFRIRASWRAWAGLRAVLVAIAVARVVNMFFTAEVPALAVAVGVTLSATVGLFFGIYPPEAARLDPSLLSDRR